MNDTDNCDRLMREGIEGREFPEAFGRATALTHLGVQLSRKDATTLAAKWYEQLEGKAPDAESAILMDYNRANAIAGSRYNTPWAWEQPTLAREICYLRRAAGHPDFSRISKTYQCMILNNLGNRLRVAGRFIEAIECWKQVLVIEPKFGMSLCNLAIRFKDYSEIIEDPGAQTLLSYAAYLKATEAIDSNAIYTHTADDRTKEPVAKLKTELEDALNLPGLREYGPFGRPSEKTDPASIEYEAWCLNNVLYLNALNDIGPHKVLAQDSLGLPTHVVPIDAQHTYSSYFDQMKQEYGSARWLLYDGTRRTGPHFSDEDVSVSVCDPRAVYSLSIEKVKAAYRVAYSLFDKIAFFLNTYMTLGIPEKWVNFRSIWRGAKDKPVRSQFDLTSNPGFCALFWLAKDFFDSETDDVSEPEARKLNEIRNHLEHKYLRVSASDAPKQVPDDLALTVSRAEFEAKALRLIRLARAALIYLVIGVRFEEGRRAPSYSPADTEPLTPPDSVPIDERT
jgi:tetratricopeptide (TPR) repeat protein